MAAVLVGGGTIRRERPHPRKGGPYPARYRREYLGNTVEGVHSAVTDWRWRNRFAAGQALSADFCRADSANGNFDNWQMRADDLKSLVGAVLAYPSSMLKDFARCKHPAQPAFDRRCCRLCSALCCCKPAPLVHVSLVRFRFDKDLVL